MIVPSGISRTKGLFPLLLLVVTSFGGLVVPVKGLHIAPTTANITTNTYSWPVSVDTSGLGSGVDFYDYDMLQVQLRPDLPVWTFYSSGISAVEHFVGESQPQGATSAVSCDLIRYNGPNGISVLTGRIHDRQNDIYYEIKPDALGQDMVSMKHGIDVVSLEPIQLSLGDALRYGSVTTLIEDYFWSPVVSSAIDDEEEQTVIDVMVVWTENGECQKSGLESGCALTAQTKATMEAAIQFMVDDANVVHANSDTGVTLSLVHMQRDTSGFREGDVFEIVLRTLIRLPYLVGLRADKKADLVTFIVDGRLIPDAGCGIGALGNWPGVIPFTITHPILGYSGVEATCTSVYTPVHEWGHNMGCNHDRGTGDTCGKCGTYYGFRSPTGTFSTVMSYPCERGECDDFQGRIPCPRIPYFSGDAHYQNGESLGGEQNSCRSQIRKTKKSISNYY